ncbi:MAG: ATP-binding cassette domain-containing protein, partial [Nitrospinae bacterium]|nr:ATP-binding cassette domain-containing protein [Nitrospinota bacterium]
MKLQGLEIARLDNVTKYYRLGEVQITALNGITLVLQEGDFTVIAGPSGSGKSTMLHLLGCIDKPDKGSIIIDGADTTGQSLEELTEVRLKRIGFIFQTFNLVPVLTAFENVELPLLFRQMGHGEIKDRVDEALHKVGLSDRMRHYPSRLSGGQQQRVA